MIIDKEIEISEQTEKVKCNVYITTIIKKYDFWLSGCFKINEDISTREWINLDGLFALPNDLFLDPIINSLKGLVVTPKEETLIIGVNYYGAIFSAIIGYRYEIPFTYCFDKRKIVSEFERDLKNFMCTKYNRFLLVIDALVYGDTVYELVNNMDIGEDVKVDLLVLFERQVQKNTYTKVYMDFRIRDIYVLNDYFAFKICDKSECKYSEDNTNRYKYQKQIT